MTVRLTLAAHVLLPWIHRVFANLKHWGTGVLHGFRKKHLERYLQEFAFRWNRRRHTRVAFDSLLSIAEALPHAFPTVTSSSSAPKARDDCLGFEPDHLGHSHMPAKTERYRFVPWEIEDVDGVARMLLGGYADVTHGGGMKYDQVIFLGPGETVRGEMRLKKGHVRKLEQFGLASKVPQTDGK